MLNDSRSQRTTIPSSVHIGGMDKAELQLALCKLGIQLNQAAEVLFEDPRFTLLSQKQVIEIDSVSVADLGFGEGATYSQFTKRAAESGLFECPLELGPYLRLQFPGQPEYVGAEPATRGQAPTGSITIASPPIDDKAEFPKGFYLRRVDGVLWLRGYRSSPDHIWRPEDVVVFCRC